MTTNTFLLSASKLQSDRLMDDISQFTESTSKEKIKLTRAALIKAHNQIVNVLKELSVAGQPCPKQFANYPPRTYPLSVLKCTVLLAPLSPPTSPCPSVATVRNPEDQDMEKGLDFPREEKTVEGISQELDSLAERTRDTIKRHDKAKHVLIDPRPLPPPPWMIIPAPAAEASSDDACSAKEKKSPQTNSRLLTPRGIRSKLNNLAERAYDSIELHRGKIISSKQGSDDPKPPLSSPVIGPVSVVKEGEVPLVFEKVDDDGSKPMLPPVSAQIPVPVITESKASPVSVKADNVGSKPMLSSLSAQIPVPVFAESKASPVLEKADNTGSKPMILPVSAQVPVPVVAKTTTTKSFRITPAPQSFVPTTSFPTIRQTPILTEIKIHCKVPAGHALFIRGSGAGLNWDSGVALQKTDGDTYVYRIRGARGDLEYKILLDDTQWERGENHRIEEGKAQEFTPDLVIPEVVAPVVEAPKLLKTTKIAVNIDVGLGNKLFIRGNGHGLSWEKGVEMQYKDGKWVFETTEEFDNLEYKFLLNDNTQKWDKGDNHKTTYGRSEELTIRF